MSYWTNDKSGLCHDSQAIATFADFWLKIWASTPYTKQRDPYYIKTWAIITAITLVLGTYR